MMVPALNAELDLERSNRNMRELMARIPSIWETQARMYMEGLKTQSDSLAKTLGPN